MDFASDKFASDKYWDSRYAQGGTSGYGSYGEQLAKKLDWIAPLEFKTITEIGCGDFNFGNELLKRHPASYAGFDISKVVVERNQLLYPAHHFGTLEGAEIPQSDVVLCVDVLFHILDDTAAERTLTLLERLWTKYLVVTAYEQDQPGKVAPHVRPTKLDLSRFGTPILREIVEEDGQLYFYIFKR